jgi:Zn-finger nucleic acid-binding protein
VIDSMEVCPDCECEVQENWAGDFRCPECGGFWELVDEDDEQLEESFDSGADDDGG